MNFEGEVFKAPVLGGGTKPLVKFGIILVTFEHNLASNNS